MNRPTRTLLAAACLLALATHGHAADVAVGPLAIVHPWSRPTPPSAPTAVGYLTLVNHGGAPDRLLGLSSPAAKSVDIHSMSMTGGVMRMRPVEGGLAIPAHATVTLGPDGDHLMFTGLTRPFKAGDHIPITLRFEHAGQAHAQLEVEAAGDAMPAMPGMGGH